MSRRGRSLSLDSSLARLLVPGAAVLVLAVVAARAEVLTYTAHLDGAGQDPPVATDAAGTLTLVVDTDTGEGAYVLEFADLSSPQTGAHFHRGAPGEVGTLLHALPLRSPASGTWLMSAQEAAWLTEGLVYANVHSQLHVGGEIRGQLRPAGQVGREDTAFGSLKARYR